MSDICVFGDSITKGVIYDEVKGTYRQLKKSFVSLVQDKTGISFRNFSRFGCTGRKGEEILKRKISQIQSGSFTLLEFGGNDCDLDWHAVSDDPSIPRTAKISLSEFHEIMRNMVDDLRKADSRPIFLSLPPLVPERFVAWVSRDLNLRNIMRHIDENPAEIFQWQEEYNKEVCSIAKETAAILLDIRSLFINKENYADYICIDGIHPNEAGHAMIADFLASALPCALNGSQNSIESISSNIS